MKTKSYLFALAALLILGIASASAGGPATDREAEPDTIVLERTPPATSGNVLAEQIFYFPAHGSCSGSCNSTSCSCTGSLSCCIAGCNACWDVLDSLAAVEIHPLEKATEPAKKD